MTKAQSSIRIILGPEESEILRDAGECFLVACRGSYPDAANRFVIHALPADRKLIEQAIEVIQGTRRTIKPRTPKQ